MTTTRVEVAWPRPGDLTDEQLETLTRTLPDRPGLPTVIDDGHIYLYARFGLDTNTLADAATYAVDRARAAWRAAFGVDVDPVQLAVAPADMGLIPGPMDLIGGAAAGEVIGTARQYVAQMLHAGRLPSPLGYPSGGAVWVRRSIETIAAQRAARTSARRRAQ